ncbi:MAG: mannose-6-phosphate isomerase, class I [Cyclobacteriaceae bacterium]
MPKVFRLKGTIQNYAWGGKDFIADLIGVEKSSKPVAEYWLGAHANSPSVVSTSEGEITLDKYLDQDLTGRLGENVRKAFGRLPFLFKVLDVKDMLSIQVHPTKKQAEIGYEKDNAAGVQLNASNRNFKDDNHKPEIMVALSEFWLLHGFLPEEKLHQTLNNVPEFNHLIPTFDSAGYKGLYQQVMEQSQEQCNENLKPLIERILPKYENGELDKSSPDFWAARAVKLDSTNQDLDKGIYSIYFFNIVKANQGEAVFQDAGLPHAYLEGQNIELMANSDNVLRGGLTPKHVDIQELMAHVKFEETIPNIIKGDLSDDTLERTFPSPVKDFELSKVEVTSKAIYERKCETVEIILLFDGETTVSENGNQIALKQGEVVLATYGADYKISSESGAVLFKASVPV